MGCLEWIVLEEGALVRETLCLEIGLFIFLCYGDRG